MSASDFPTGACLKALNWVRKGIVSTPTDLPFQGGDRNQQPPGPVQDEPQPQPPPVVQLQPLAPPLPPVPPKTPLELILIWLWQHRVGRLLAITLGILAAVALAAQGIEPLIKLFGYLATPKVAKAAVPEYKKDGYYVETRRTVFDMGSWRDVTPAQEDVKTSLVVCNSNFTIYRQKPDAVNFIHRISSTAKVAPEVFSDRPFVNLPVEGYTELGKARLWESE